MLDAVLRVGEHLGDPGWTIPVAAALCFVVGCVVGLPALRLKGIYLASTTLVFVEAVRSTLKYEKFESITGGSTGIKGDKYTPPEYVFDVFGLKLPTGLDGRADLNQWMIFRPVAGAAAAHHVARVRADAQSHRAGDGRHACDELAAEVMGVNLSVIKTVVFGLSGAITGVGGALFGLKLGLVDGDVPLFGLFGAITFLVAMVVGGAAQNWGPLVGAVFYVFVNEIASVGEAPSDYESTFVVVLVVLVVIVVGVVIRYLMPHADDIRSNISNGTVKAVAVVVGSIAALIVSGVVVLLGISDGGGKLDGRRRSSASC